jgi:hypothetical protein
MLRAIDRAFPANRKTVGLLPSQCALHSVYDEADYPPANDVKNQSTEDLQKNRSGSILNHFARSRSNSWQTSEHFLRAVIDEISRG